MDDARNALEIIRFGRPQRVAMGIPGEVLCYFGCNHESWDGGGHHLPVGSRWLDIWGTQWHREHDGVMGFPRGNPLADLPSALKIYRWPDPDDERLCGPIHARARSADRAAGLLGGSHRDTLWERAYMLVGMENLMGWMHDEPGAVAELFQRIMDFQLGMARHYLAVGIQVAHLGDDLGTQRALLMSPRFLAGMLAPQYRRLTSLYRERGVLLNFHSCGHIEPALDLFIELGIDVLNPVQANANDLAALRRRTQGRLALAGGVGSEVVVAGPPERIRAVVRQRLWELGRDGGYFCSPDQGMPWPEAHYRAFQEAVAEFGAYPLRQPEPALASVA